MTEVQKADNTIDHVIQRADQILYQVKKGRGEQPGKRVIKVSMGIFVLGMVMPQI